MTIASESADTLGELGDRTLRKVRRRVMPLIVLLYFIAYLDRNNVGFAKLTMSEDIGLSAAAYGLGAGIFFLGYALLEVPSNAGMYKFGARKWLARILITWGIFATAMALVNGETTYYIIRFLLGAAEAGFFPAILFYLTLWFPAAQRVTVLGIFILAQPISNALGAPVSGLLLQMDRPRDAKWLNADEREWLATTMDAELAAKSKGGSHNFLAGLKDKRTI